MEVTIVLNQGRGRHSKVHECEKSKIWTMQIFGHRNYGSVKNITKIASRNTSND